MKIKGIIAVLALALTMMMSTDAAARSGDKMDKGMMYDKMAGHHEMTTEVMGMFKETLVILKDMNHTPTAAQKKRLEEMITRMDEVIKKHEEHMKNACDWKQKKMDRKKDGMKDGMMKNPCGADAK